MKYFVRKQTREVKIALAAKDPKKAGELEIKKLANILSQVQTMDQNHDNEDNEGRSSIRYDML